MEKNYSFSNYTAGKLLCSLKVFSSKLISNKLLFLDLSASLTLYTIFFISQLVFQKYTSLKKLLLSLHFTKIVFRKLTFVSLLNIERDKNRIVSHYLMVFYIKINSKIKAHFHIQKPHHRRFISYPNSIFDHLLIASPYSLGRARFALPIPVSQGSFAPAGPPKENENKKELALATNEYFVTEFLKERRLVDQIILGIKILFRRKQ